MHATNRLYGDSALVMNITPGGARLPMTFVQRYQLSGCNVLNKNWDCLIWLGSESTDCVNRHLYLIWVSVIQCIHSFWIYKNLAQNEQLASFITHNFSEILQHSQLLLWLWTAQIHYNLFLCHRLSTIYLQSASLRVHVS